jgi:hypothetical protein
VIPPVERAEEGGDAVGVELTVGSSLELVSRVVVG